MTFGNLNLNSLLKRSTALHVLMWAIFITYEITYVHFVAGVTAGFFHYLIYYAFNIALFYFNAHGILSYAFFKTNRPYLVSIVLILAEIIIFLTIKFILDFFAVNGHGSFIAHLSYTRKFIADNIYRCIYFVGMSIAYWSTLYLFAYKDKNHKIETEYLKEKERKLVLEYRLLTAENAYLQAQVSPHLLFNTLNFIYSSMETDTYKAGEGIIHLADLMRYSVRVGASEAPVLLTQELEQVETLLQLSRLRFGNEIQVRLIQPGNLADVQILPLILITMVENMLKHGDLSSPDDPGLIFLAYEDHLLTMRTRNRKRKSKPYNKSGLGIANIGKRLACRYPESNHVDVSDQNDYFEITIQIKYL